MDCIIIEDQPPAQRILKKYIEDSGALKLKASFSDAIQAMQFLNKEPVDLIFLDIHLPKLSGIEFLKTLSQKPSIILTTAFPDYALESYELDVVDYLLKPFSFQRFLKAISKVHTKEAQKPDVQESTSSAYRKDVFIKSGYDHIKIRTEAIFYIKSDADYTELYLTERKVLSSEPLRYWLEILIPDQFVRVHKSFIVNISKIEKVSGSKIYMEDGNIIPVGRAYKDQFVKQFIH